MTKDEALKMAIEALETADAIVTEYSGVELESIQLAINACKEALEQTTSLENVIKEFEKDPEMKALLDLARKQVKGMKLNPEFDVVHYEQPAQEPVAWIKVENKFASIGFNYKTSWVKKDGYTPVYTHPHQWQGLTDAENEAIIQSIWEWGNDFPYDEYRICIEQALKEKNT